MNISVVDVRDVVSGHLAAMTSPEAVGKRHILSTQNVWLIDVAEILAKEFKPQGYKISTTAAPEGQASTGREEHFDNTRMKEVLGIEPIGVSDMLLDMAYSMIENGSVEKASKYTGPRK